MLKAAKFFSVLVPKAVIWLRVLLTIGVLTGLLYGCQGPSVMPPVDNASINNNLDPNVYRVQNGDTIYNIAWKNNIDYQKIVALNHLQPPYNIQPGQQLILRQSQTTAVEVSTGQVQAVALTNTSPASQNPNWLITPSKKTTVLATQNPVVQTPKSPATELTQSGISWQWPAQGEIISNFTDKKDLTAGLDIAGKKGQPVYAAAAGKVVYAGDGVRGYGKLIIVKHNDHFLSAYAHNDQLLVKEDQTVAKGQQIATMGDTQADQVKLHFEIRQDGRTKDPLTFLPKQ